MAGEERNVEYPADRCIISIIRREVPAFNLANYVILPGALRDPTRWSREHLPEVNKMHVSRHLRNGKWGTGVARGGEGEGTRPGDLSSRYEGAVKIKTLLYPPPFVNISRKSATRNAREREKKRSGYSLLQQQQHQQQQ